MASWMFIGVLGACWHGYGAELQEFGRLLLASAEYDGRVPGEGTGSYLSHLNPVLHSWSTWKCILVCYNKIVTYGGTI